MVPDTNPTDCKEDLKRTNKERLDSYIYPLFTSYIPLCSFYTSTSFIVKRKMKTNVSKKLYKEFHLLFTVQK